jgi:hypothetical protein
VWAERVLRALLEPRSRDTVSGDLFEEYREAIVPARGLVRARLWYCRQVLSFVTPHTAWRAFTGTEGETPMACTCSRASLPWIATGLVALFTIMVALVRSRFAPPVGLGVAVPIALAVGAMGLSSARRADLRSLARTALLWGGIVAAVLLVRLFVEVIAPVDPVEGFLAQARDDYSVLDYPRRWVPAWAVAMAFLAAGFTTAARTAVVSRGTLAAMAASVVGSILYLALVAALNMLPMGTVDPHGDTPPQLLHFGNVPFVLAPVLLMFSAVLGAVGALFGRGLARTA